VFKPKINKTSEIIMQQRARKGEENVETSSMGDSDSITKDRFAQLYE
jgi:hypothetical protein